LDYSIPCLPAIVTELEAKSLSIGFTMPSDRHIGSFLRTLVMSKPSGKFLELGTGIGLSLAWMIDGLQSQGHVTSIDNDPELIEISREYFAGIANLDLICEDGTKWIQNYKGEQFDLIFADAWPGKYRELDETICLLKPGGFYVIDDMNVQPNWPDGHAEKASRLVEELENRSDLLLTKFDWSTGVILGVKMS